MSVDYLASNLRLTVGSLMFLGLMWWKIVKLVGSTISFTQPFAKRYCIRARVTT